MWPSTCLRCAFLMALVLVQMARLELLSEKSKQHTIYLVARQLGATKFLSLVDKVNLGSILKNSNANVTLFAPNNKAFSTFPKSELAKLLNDTKLLNEVLRYHIAIGFLCTKELKNEDLLKTLAKHGQLALRQRLLIRANIYQQHSPLKKVITVSGSKIIKADQQASGGVVNLVDKLMYPLPLKNTFYVLTESQEHFSSLSNFLEKSFVLMRLLSSDQPLTFLAPTNEAFSKLSADIMKKLSDVVFMSKVFSKHTFWNTRYLAGITDGYQIKSVNGEKLIFHVNHGNVSVCGNNVSSAIVYPDISTMNGVIHAIDTILLEG